MLTFILLKNIYIISQVRVGVFPPIFGADMRQSRRLAARPRRFSTAITRRQRENPGYLAIDLVTDDELQLADGRPILVL